MRIALGLVFVAGAGVALAGDDSPAPPDWRAAAAKAGLAAEEMERLGRMKVLVAGAEFRQSFEPYIRSDAPTFVTSDSVLNAYHVLLEESVVRLERARAAELPAILRLMWNGLPGAAKRFDVPSSTFAPALLRAQVTVGCALRLVGDETPGVSEEAAALIATETARVVRAEERVMPAWLAEPSPGYAFLDYGRFRPRGFYTRDERLSAHFRATAFLQDVRLRIANDGEFVTALLLADALDSGRSKWDRSLAYEKFVGTWESFLGARGDLPLTDLPGLRDGDLRNADDISNARARAAREWHDRNGGSESSGPPGQSVLHGVEPSLRLLPATSLPDGRLFDECCPPSGTPVYPSGLFVAAALGGRFARREALRDRTGAARACLERALADGENTLAPGGAPPSDEMDEPMPGGDRGRDVYSLYLRAIASLLDAPEPDAPEFVRSEAWQAKSTNTALAGWAQMRHTWVLQARESALWGSAESTCAGFVEPDPEFFGRLADCAGASWDLLDRAGAFDEHLDRRELLWALRDYAAFLRGGGGARTKRALSDAESRVVEFGESVVALLGGPKVRPSYEEAMSGESVAGALRILDDAAVRLDSDAALPGDLRALATYASRPFRRTCIQFERLCRRLAAMAQKELRGADWDDDERRLLLDYGHVLARAMLYEGNSYVSPPDDAPRAACVYAWLGAEPAGYLHAAVARPRALHVLYPWKGREVLCVGSVLPYREFVAAKRLTDDEWRAMLGTKDAPQEPVWFAPIASPPPVK